MARGAMTCRTAAASGTARFTSHPAGIPGSAAKLTKGAKPVLALWLIVALLVLFAIIGGVAIGKFLFLILIAAAILALFGLFSRTA